MTNDYKAPDPKIAEFVYAMNRECDRQSARLKNASPNELRFVARNRTESNAARSAAIAGLISVRDPEFNELLLELFDDADQDLWRLAIAGANLKDPRIRERLRSLLEDFDDENWSQAAVTLARAGDETLLARFISWLREGDEGHRNVAVECLKFLKTPAALTALQDFWDSHEGDDEIRLVVAAALLHVGNPCGRKQLESAVRDGEGNWSVFAATSIYIAEPRDGLMWMLWILDNGTLDAKQAMVNQIWNFSHLPHAFTADGLSEARVWVESQLYDQA